MMGRTLNRISKLRERRPPPCNCFGCAVKQIAATELATPAQMSTAAEMRPDMNGSSVVNGHASVNGAQANDRLIGCANGHANGDAMDRNRCSVTDVADPTFSTTFDRETSNIPTSDDHVHTQNAEVQLLI